MKATNPSLDEHLSELARYAKEAAQAVGYAEMFGASSPTQAYELAVEAEHLAVLALHQAGYVGRDHAALSEQMVDDLTKIVFQLDDIVARASLQRAEALGAGCSEGRAQEQVPNPRMGVRDALAELDLAPGASEQNVKAAYRRLAVERHPDRAGGDLESMKRLNEARDVLLALGTSAPDEGRRPRPTETSPQNTPYARYKARHAPKPTATYGSDDLRAFADEVIRLGRIQTKYRERVPLVPFDAFLDRKSGHYSRPFGSVFRTRKLKPEHQASDHILQQSDAYLEYVFHRMGVPALARIFDLAHGPTDSWVIFQTIPVGAYAGYEYITISFEEPKVRERRAPKDQRTTRSTVERQLRSLGFEDVAGGSKYSYWAPRGTQEKYGYFVRLGAKSLRVVHRGRRGRGSYDSGIDDSPTYYGAASDQKVREIAALAERMRSRDDNPTSDRPEQIAEYWKRGGLHEGATTDRDAYMFAFGQDIELLMCGGSRCVFRLPSGRVIKLPWNNLGATQNLTECDNWRRADEATRLGLAAVYSCAKDGSYLVMEEVRPLRSDEGDEWRKGSERYELQRRLGLWDLHKGNVGYRGDQLVVLDYGDSRIENPDPHRFQFLTDCVSIERIFGSPEGGQIIGYITQHASEHQVTYRQFARQVDLAPLRAAGHPAMWRLSSEDNWAVSFHRSQLPSGQPIYYFDWSRIEHIFVDRPVDVQAELAALAAWRDAEEENPKRHDARAVGKTVKEYAASPRMYELLDAYSETAGTTPTQGGCWPLAQAVALITGGTVVAVVDLGSDPKQAQHAVVALGGGYIDADGFSTRSKLVKRWKSEGLVEPSLIPWPAARTGGLVCPSGLVAAIASDLRPHRPAAQNPERGTREKFDRIFRESGVFGVYWALIAFLMHEGNDAEANWIRQVVKDKAVSAGESWESVASDMLRGRMFAYTPPVKGRPSSSRADKYLPWVGREGKKAAAFFLSGFPEINNPFLALERFEKGEYASFLGPDFDGFDRKGLEIWDNLLTVVKSFYPFVTMVRSEGIDLGPVDVAKAGSMLRKRQDEGSEFGSRDVIPGKVVYEWDDGWSVHRLEDEAQLKSEGKSMDHCVGGYADGLESEYQIYSLRKGTRPAATMEWSIDDDEYMMGRKGGPPFGFVQQVKGPLDEDLGKEALIRMAEFSTRFFPGFTLRDDSLAREDDDLIRQITLAHFAGDDDLHPGSILRLPGRPSGRVTGN